MSKSLQAVFTETPMAYVAIGRLIDSGLTLVQGDNISTGHGGGGAERRPIGHQPPALFQERAASICGLDLVGDRMS
jgi:hypothetical protein